MRRSRITAYVTSPTSPSASPSPGAATAQASGTVAATGYVALGDSYSSGVGAGSYISSSGDCLRSAKAYPYLWAAARCPPSSFDFTACSGARTGDVLANQLGPLSSSTGLVSLSIGGNDAGFADVMTTCVLQSDSGCLSRIATAKAYVNSTLPGQLDSVYSAISSKAPAAHVVVLGYPRFYKLGATCLGLSDTSAAINGAAPTTWTAPSPSAPPTTASPSATSGAPSPVTSLLRQRLAAQPEPARHHRVVPPHRGRPLRRLPAGLHLGRLTAPHGDVEAEASSDGCSVAHVTENGTELDVVRTGLRTSTLISFWKIPLALYVVKKIDFLFGPATVRRERRVFQPGSDTSPVFGAQRYWTSTGTRPTVKVAVKVGAWAWGGGQEPE